MWWGGVGQVRSHLRPPSLPTAPTEPCPPPGKRTSITENKHTAVELKVGSPALRMGSSTAGSRLLTWVTAMEAGSSQAATQAHWPACWPLGLLKQEIKREQARKLFRFSCLSLGWRVNLRLSQTEQAACTCVAGGSTLTSTPLPLALRSVPLLGSP